MKNIEQRRPRFERLRGEANFYFVRHGQSESNRNGLMQGRTDGALSPTGREQARITGRWLADHAGLPLQPFTSPLMRCRTTAEIIATEAGLAEPQIDERLVEIDIGMFSNESPTNAEKRWPEEWRRFQIESWEGVPQAEPIASLTARAADYWDNLIERARAGESKIVSITHGGILQWLIKATFDPPPANHWMPIFSIANCGISHFRVRPVDYSDSGDIAAGYFGNWLLLSFLAY